MVLPTIEGNVQDFRRIKTGLWSIDQLLSYRGNAGFPLRTISELYGYPGTGKSTLAYYLAARINQTGEIYLVDLEASVEREHLMNSLIGAQFQGKLKLVDAVDKKGKPRNHSDMCQEGVDALMQPTTNALIVDSVGAFASDAEASNDIGEANMGRRAMSIAQISRRAMSHLRTTEAEPVVFFVNHVHPNIGSRGHLTPGGRTLKHAAGYRLMLRRIEGFDNGASVVEVKAEKKRLGGVTKDRGRFVIIPGIGVSREMSAIIDCVELGLATRGNTIKLDGKSFGYISKLVLAASEEEPDIEKFEPFFMALENYGKEKENESENK
jgi:RecA/RadA recombinase